jgi:CheY-like chemotaxis protein
MWPEGNEHGLPVNGTVKKVLILEPDAELRDLFAHIIGRLGHEAVGASNGTRLDLVLLEPVSDEDLAVARALRREQPELPVICASTISADGRVAELSPVSYLLKPFSPAELSRAIDRALARS